MNSHHPLEGVIQKLRRADHHLVTLYNETARYINENPHSISIQRDLGNGYAGIIFNITKEPPVYLATIIGDAIHNLRASLDYIAHELTVANGATPDRQTQFPIALTEDDFFHQAITLKKLHRVSMKALKYVSAFQPYRLTEEKKRRSHMLWQLSKLSNMDKHHMLALSAIGTEATTMFTHPDGRTLTSEFNNTLVHDATVVATMPIDFFHEKMQTHFKLTTRIAFVEAPLTDHEPVGVIQNIRQFIGELIVPAVEPFFEPLPEHLRLKAHGLPPSVVQNVTP